MKKIDDAGYEEIQSIADQLFRQHLRRRCGQAITKMDSHDYWIMMATRELLSADELPESAGTPELRAVCGCRNLPE